MRRLVALALLACAVAAANAAAAGRATLNVYAAASLTDVFPKIDSAERYSFGGSNTLAAQITQGAPADVFASANTALPQSLYAKGLVTKPVVFTRNTLVLIVPTSNPAGIHSVFDLRRSEIKLVVAQPAVPVGGYTLQILKNMALSDVLQNVVSRESDVREVLAKVALGEADAGFVYSTDAKTVSGKVTVLKLPAWASRRGIRRCGGHRRPEPRRCAGVRDEAPRQSGTEAADRRRIPPARQAMSRAWFNAALVVATTVVLLFLALPVIAIFTHVSPITLVQQLTNPVVDDALLVTLKTTIAAQALVLILGTPTAYFLASRRFAAVRCS